MGQQMNRVLPVVPGGSAEAVENQRLLASTRLTVLRIDRHQKLAPRSRAHLGLRGLEKAPPPVSSFVTRRTSLRLDSRRRDSGACAPRPLGYTSVRLIR